MGFQLTADQTLAVENTGGPLLVSAAAGSGKTRVLVQRLLERIYAGADVKDFLIITFTNAAAAELKQRIGEELNNALAQRGRDRHLRRQLLLVYDAHVSTIHSFCQGVLRQWGHLLDLDSDFRLLDQGETDLLCQEAMEELLEKRYASPDEALERLLDTFSPGRDDAGLSAMALDVYRKLQSHPDPLGWIAQQKAALELSGVRDPAETVWGEYLLQRYRKVAEYWYEQLAPVAEACVEGVPKYAPSFAETVRDLDRLRHAEGWDQAGTPVFPRLGSSAKCPDPELAGRAKALREGCKSQFEKIGKPFERAGEAVMEDLRTVAPACRELLDLVADFSEGFQALKKRRNVLDFNDLEHKTLELLRRNGEVARELSESFAEVMVDEYQDTNEVQNAIFNALTAARGNLFMVGDVKQSIYRFRLADPTIFLEKYQTYPPASQAGAGQGRRVMLGENFRSRPEVIDGVNFLFENLMNPDMGEMAYGAEEALKAGGTFPRREDCAPEFYLLANPKADEDGDNTMTEPRFIARRLRRMVEEGFPVADGQGGLRPARWEDMAILHRAPGRVLGRYQRALEEEGIPWQSEGAEDFFDTPETSVALSYLEIIDNPRQDVPLIAVLRSPLYGYSPDRLAQLKSQKGDGCYFDALKAEARTREDSQAFLEELSRLRLLSQDKRSYELLWEVYRSTGMLVLYSAMEDGESRREHLLGLYSYAKRFEGSGHKGLFGFLNHLRHRRELGEALTVAGGGGTRGVRILSIHRSKGLEYPIVVVAGLGKQLNHMDAQAPMLFHRKLGLGPNGMDPGRLIRYPTLARWAVAEKLEEEMRGEELRLLYVALTRAKEKLIMTCAMKDPHREVDKLLEIAALPPSPQALMRQSTVGHWILAAALTRPEAALLRDGRLTAPIPAGAKLGTRWVMELVEDESLTRPRRRGDSTPAEGTAGTAEVPDYRWSYPYAAASLCPSKLTATQIKGRALDEEVETDSGKGPEEPLPPPGDEEAEEKVIFDRPHFALEEKGLTPGERGTAHHLVMQYLDFSKTADAREIREEIQRLVEDEIITPQQGRAVKPETILRFFQSPLGREVTEQGDGLRREFKFSLLVDARRYFPELEGEETVLLQGVVDAWFDTPEGLVILDFKNDYVTRENVMERAESYRPQLQAYAEALAVLLGRPVKRTALYFFSTGQTVEL